MLKLSKKIALPLIAVLLIGTGIGGYFLFRDFKLPKYSVDRYPELIEYCDTKESENDLKVSCKALMLGLNPNVTEGTPSVRSLIITNKEELKEYTITEKEATFAFTNDVLQFKKLKPVVINIQYVKKNPLQYTLQSITFDNISDTYIQDIVNRDINEVMGMDFEKYTATIYNSFDFCPRPEKLPDYVIKKEDYKKYWEDNILTESEYNLSLGFFETNAPTLRVLFTCESMQNIGYESKCYNPSPDFTKAVESAIEEQPVFTPKWDEEMREIDKVILKQISYTYDNKNLFLRDYMPLVKRGEYTIFVINNSNVLEALINSLNSSSLTEEVFCGTYKLFKNARTPSNKVAEYIKSMEDIISTSLPSIESVMCLNSVSEDLVDTTGVYLKVFFSDYNDDLLLYNRCSNLQYFIK